jgi:putative FmdB family regulatory protein
MPLYEYECRACHKRTEKIQKFSDPEITICPHCGGDLERTITAPAFQFAGGGFRRQQHPCGSGGALDPCSGGGSAIGAGKIVGWISCILSPAECWRNGD